MSERKAINKYYPPDYDPSLVPKKVKNVNQVQKVRLMAPFSMRCTKCNEYIAARRKFNARKEVTKEKYMDFKIIRFHITCPRCNSTMTFKTDPKSAGFLPESGCVRNYESTATKINNAKEHETEEEILERLEREEKENASFQLLREKRKKNPFWQKKESLKDGEGDLMENLEKKLTQQQKQQEINEHLEYLQAKNSEVARSGGSEKMAHEAREAINKEIAELKQLQQQVEEEEDEEESRRAFKKFKAAKGQESDRSASPPDGATDGEKDVTSIGVATPSTTSKVVSTPLLKVASTISIKKRPHKSETTAKNSSAKATTVSTEAAPRPTAEIGIPALIGGYSSEEEE